jgi:hypothetical protein
MIILISKKQNKNVPLLIDFKGQFGSKERKWEERNLRKSMNEFKVTLVQIHSLICVILFPLTFFPSNQTKPKMFLAPKLVYKYYSMSP